MAHNEFHMLKKLIHELDDVRNDIYIHIDKKTRIVDEKMIASWAERSGVFFVPGMKIYWGTISQVKCEIAMLEAALPGHYHYYHLISGMDFPLKDQDYIHQLLEEENSEFLKYHADGENNDPFLYKVKYYHPLHRFVGKGDFEGPGRKNEFMRWLGKQQWFIQDYQERHGVDRTKKYSGITFYKGTNWFSITHDFAEYVIAQKQRIFRIYRLTNGPDEFVMPTLALNSSFADRVKKLSLRHIDWDRGKPYEFTEDDLEELKESDALFARKISYDHHPLLVNKLMAAAHGISYSGSKPLISIVVPCYNVEKYLPECIDSLVGQTYPNTEILLIDDGSTDNTSGIAMDYADRYSNVIYKHRENGGLSAARNTGIELSKGEYLAFVDSDDWVDAEYIDKLYNAVKYDMTDMAACGFVREDNEKESVTFADSRVISAYSAMRILGDIYPDENVLMVVSWNKLYRREIFSDIRFPEGIIHEDEFMAHNVVAKVDSVSLIRECLYHYRIRKDSIMGNDKRQDLRHLDLLEAYENRLSCTYNMLFQNLFVYMLYTYYEGMIQLMVKYSDETIKKNRLFSLFRKKAIHIYLKYFKNLVSYQKKEYLKLIISPRRYREEVIRKLSEKA